MTELIDDKIDCQIKLLESKSAGEIIKKSQQSGSQNLFVRLATDSSTQLNDFPHAALFSSGGGSGAARQQVERSQRLAKPLIEKQKRWHRSRKSANVAPREISGGQN